MTKYEIDLDDEEVAYLRTMFPGDPQAAAITATQQHSHPCIRPRDRIIAQAFLATATPGYLFAPTPITPRSYPYDQDDPEGHTAIDTDDLLTWRTAIPIALSAIVAMAIIYAIIRAIEAF